MQENSEELEEILDKKFSNGIYRYKIKWKGSSIDECTWELAENLTNYASKLEAFDEGFIESSEGKKQKGKKEKKQENNNELLINKKRYFPSNSEQNAKKIKKLISPKIKDNANSNNDFLFANQLEGSFKTDKPYQIISAKRHANNPCDLLLEIEWEMRKNGVKPKNTKVKNSELKRHAPELLCDFYEKHIVFPKNY